jgi:hypothetical protein
VPISPHRQKSEQRSFSLTQSQTEYLEFEARRWGVSTSEVVRRVLDRSRSIGMFSQADRVTHTEGVEAA